MATRVKKATQAKKAVVITISGDRPIHEMTGDLRAAGLEVGQVLESIGSVTGVAPVSRMRKLRSVRGVADVSEDHPVHIGPPDASVS